ncbi:hypothetical protein LZ554_009564 [Drepanopeziza brunnea f. sp. 'monogermtubi']|nr:hypothetical protein LZ554_009564 [Drepanopeziza brunnea f. sp. 'monogermtubi']
MASPPQQKAFVELTAQDLTRGTNDYRNPIAKPTVKSFAAAALEDLARRMEQPREDIDLTTEEGSVLLIGENNHITQLRVVISQLCRKLRESSNWSTPQYTTLELQFHTLVGTVEYIKEQEKILKARQDRCAAYGEYGALWSAGLGEIVRMRLATFRFSGSISGLYVERKWFQSTLDRHKIFNKGLNAGSQQRQSELNATRRFSRGILNRSRDLSTSATPTDPLEYKKPEADVGLAPVLRSKKRKACWQDGSRTRPIIIDDSDSSGRESKRRQFRHHERSQHTEGPIRVPVPANTVRVKELLRSSRKVVVINRAGISTNAGFPTFQQMRKSKRVSFHQSLYSSLVEATQFHSTICSYSHPSRRSPTSTPHHTKRRLCRAATTGS